MPVKTRKNRIKKWIVTHGPYEKLAYENWKQRGRIPVEGIEYWLETGRLLKEKLSLN